MNQETFIKRLEEEHQACVEISRKKNLDYSSLEDAFLNFRSSTSISVDPRVGIMVRMLDKLVRTSQLLNKDPSVVEESIKDSMRDLANYALILALFVEDEKG